MSLLKYFCEKKSSWFIWYLIRAGVKIGNQCYIYNPKSTLLDLTRPYLITLGDNVKIARGAIILTHGFEWSVLREIYKRPFGNCASVKIGNNVFIGMNAIVLKGVSIGSNTVIGAGAVVSHDIPNDSVVAGNPAKVVCTIEQLYEKFVGREQIEAFLQVKELNDCGRKPIESDFFKSYFSLFLNRSESLPDVVKSQLGGYQKEFVESESEYDDFEEFLNHADQYIKKISN